MLSRITKTIARTILLLQMIASVAAQTPNDLTGHVHDEAGAAVAGAHVKFQSKSSVIYTTTADDGSFVLKGPIRNGTLTVDATGFAVFIQQLNHESPRANLKILLTPASIREQVTVTATRTETMLASTPASVRLISGRELSTTAAPTIDDALRQVPGFQLFRRSGSRTANPTSQGVSLRGVGASGASRALVLADGIPFSDPFGGWIYWDRLPRVAVNQLEVVRGGISDLYGANAVGGVINILTRRDDGPALSLETAYGNEHTPNASIYAAMRFKKFTTSLAGEVFQTAGYINVEKRSRGAVDTAVASRHRSLYMDLGYHPNENSRLFLRPSYFAESRANGTPLQTNRTHVAEIDGGADWNLRQVGELSLRGYASKQTYDQNFSAIAANRNSETITRVQRVPAQALGLMFQWSRSVGNRHSFVGGFEAREVRGASDEIVYDRGNASSLISAGGSQRSYGLFFKDTLRLTSKFSLSAGARFDLFKNLKGLNVSQSLSVGASHQVTRFPDRSESSLSPQLSALYHANEKLSLFGSIYRSFRMPTLNEFYRSFRLGNVLTLANENLRRERATGGEAGARVTLFENRFDLRASLFTTSIADPIANVTLNTSPALITRQRQNLGRTRSSGIEVDSEFRINRGWNLRAGYLFADATVVSFPANVSLEGLAISQTPRHSFTFQVNYASPQHYRFGLQGRASGPQFEDDQNLLRLREFFTLDAYVSRFINQRLELFVAGENVFSSRYELGRTPVTTVGPPALFRIGLKLNLRHSESRK